MIYEPIPPKRCTKCKELLPATSEYFSIRRDRDNRLHTQCRKCIAAIDRDRHARQAERENQVTRQWRAKHPDKVRQYNKKQRDRDPDMDKRRSKIWYAVHREDELRTKKAQYIEDPEPAKRRRKEYYAKHPDKVRQSAKKHIQGHRDQIRGRGRIITQRYRARKRNLPHTFRQSDWQRCLEYWHDCCAYCGRPTGLWHTLAQDHFIPVANGGGYTPDNILPACHGIDGCNNSKNAHDPHEWLIVHFGKRKAAQILKRIGEYFEWVTGGQYT